MTLIECIHPHLNPLPSRERKLHPSTLMRKGRVCPFGGLSEESSRSEDSDESEESEDIHFKESDRAGSELSRMDEGEIIHQMRVYRAD